MQPTNTKSKIQGLLSRTAQSSGKSEASKYIVVIWNGQEQVVAFPNHVQHSHVFEYMRNENPNLTALSAGFFLGNTKALWVGGESSSLNLQARPQDTALVKAFLTSPDRQLWDLTLITVDGGAQ